MRAIFILTVLMIIRTPKMDTTVIVKNNVKIITVTKR